MVTSLLQAGSPLCEHRLAPVLQTRKREGCCQGWARMENRRADGSSGPQTGPSTPRGQGQPARCLASITE